MRLVCPNCDAEYEVDASVIPEQGRDVQCSNCGNAWFQPSPTHAAAIADEAALFDAPARPDLAPDPEPDALPPSRGLDETVVAVLREEAEREAAARRAEAQNTLETQTEMGLTPTAPVPPPPVAMPAPPPSPAAVHIAKMKGVDPEPRPVPRPQTRREMLPAIEEINSTLRATSERRTGEPAAIPDTLPDAKTGTNSFRSGFMLVLIVAAVCVFAYVLAPRLSQQIPGLAPALLAYVATVDAGRLWLDGLMQQAISALRGLSGSAPT